MTGNNIQTKKILTESKSEFSVPERKQRFRGDRARCFCTKNGLQFGSFGWRPQTSTGSNSEILCCRSAVPSKTYVNVQGGCVFPSISQHGLFSSLRLHRHATSLGALIEQMSRQCCANTAALPLFLKRPLSPLFWAHPYKLLECSQHTDVVEALQVSAKPG